MSADAKVWKQDDRWYGVHDGECVTSAFYHEQGAQSLTEVLEMVECCSGYRYEWWFRAYPDGRTGLVGYCAGGRPFTGRHD